MANTIGNRLDRIENKYPDQSDQRCFIRIVTSAEEHIEALESAKAEGFDPESEDDIVIIRLIAGRPSAETKERDF